MALATARRAKEEAPQQRILKVAAELFARDGYHAASLRDMTEAVAVDERTVEIRFSGEQSAQAILAAVAFSPDGREVTFVSNTDMLIAASTNNDLFRMSVRAVGGKLRTGRPQRLTTSKANQNSPREEELAFSLGGRRGSRRSGGSRRALRRGRRCLARRHRNRQSPGLVA